MPEFWDLRFQRACSFCLYLLGVLPWYHHERKLNSSIERWKATPRRNDLPQPTGWQAARHVSGAILVLPVQLIHPLNATTCESWGDASTPANGHTHTWTGIQILSWWADVCEVVPLSHCAVRFPEAVSGVACYVQKPYACPCLHVHQLWEVCLVVPWYLGYVGLFWPDYDFHQSCCPLMVIQIV